MSWFVYIIEASDSSLYTGITTDFQQHATGQGAKYFKGRRPVKFVYSEKVDNRSRASIREASIKKLTRLQKLQLIRP